MGGRIEGAPPRENKLPDADSKIVPIESYTCVKCKDASKNILVLPCKHFDLCEHCYKNLPEEQLMECYSCKAKLTNYIHVFNP